MKISEVEAKSILRKNSKIDSWFISSYGMNLYRGCTHNCSYCDGRAEKYQVEGEFGKDIAVKINAIDILRRELNPVNKRKPFSPGFFVVGGGVCDSYQPVEKKYKLTRQALELLKEFNHPIHILTKSLLIERDLDLIKIINRHSKAVVSISFSSVDDDISTIFEPGVPLPSERLQLLQKIKSQGIACGVFLLPVIPYVTDSKEKIAESLKAANKAGADYVLFGGMTLKAGRQQEYFIDKLRQYNPNLIEEYQNIYPGNEWGAANGPYYDTIYQRYVQSIKKYPVAGRIPLHIFRELFDTHHLVVILLEHIDYYLKLKGIKSSYGYFAHLIAKQKDPIRTINDLDLKSVQVPGAIRRVIQDIIETGSSPLYNELTKKFV